MSETWSSSFWNVCNCFDDFRTNSPKDNGRSRRKENTNFPNWRWARSKNVCLSSARLDSLVVTKRAVLRICWDLSTLNNTFCFVQLQNQVLAGLVIRGYVWYFGFFYVVCLTSHTMLNKKQSIFWKCVLCRFGSVQSFWWFPYKPSWKGEKVGRCHQN